MKNIRFMSYFILEKYIMQEMVSIFQPRIRFEKIALLFDQFHYKLLACYFAKTLRLFFQHLTERLGFSLPIIAIF